jgi:uncharacterized protein YndB with AHSA1/START domain
MKKLLVVIAGILGVGLALPLILPSHFTLTRSIRINAPLDQVFQKLTDLNEYVKWNPFPEGDPTNTETVSGNGIGSSMIWKGEKTGEGKMTLANIELNKEITVKMEFYKPMAGEGEVYWRTQSLNEKETELSWVFEQNLPYFNRYFGLFAESMMGKHFERGLENFKKLIEDAGN